MADLPPHPDPGHDARVEPNHRQTEHRWRTYVVGLVVVGLVALMVVLHLTGTIGPSAH